MVQCLTMGQNSSLPKGRKKSMRSLLRKSSIHKSHLSHTFNIIEYENKLDLLNINLATEEELMTLPGISREIASNIVHHRKEIGRFRKVEDLALVRGVGATKLEQIKPEICVSTKLNHSCNSSRAQSYDSLRSNDSRLTLRSLKAINVNKATVFELQGVHGITQEIAASIIAYRLKKGPFKKVEDLIKVKQMDRVRLDNVARYLTVDGDDASDQDEGTRPSILTNGYTMPGSHAGLHHRTNGGPPNMPMANGLSMSSAIDIFELLSAYSPRPIIEEVFKYGRDGQPAVRVATWNLHGFSDDKAANFGVKEVVCRTILENGLSIIAIQDVVNVTALRSICEELNNPRLRRIKEWKDRNHNWNFCMLDVENSKLGFIYDSDGVSIELSSLNEGPKDTNEYCEVLISTFRVGPIDLQLVNMTLNPVADVHLIKSKLREFITDDEMMVLFVDFSNVKKPIDDFFPVEGLKTVFPLSTNTTFTNSKLDTLHHRSNTLISKKMQDHLTSYYGVIRHGMTHLAIPNGWSWGGPVSPYCPTWTEFFLYSNPDTAL
ncbi:endonuclease/exonuclease/phosphatase family domain-containing protein 1-like isoform X2 [Aethina tumida]|uniref:endonuclease/exonuclease/phosphatase family domain-containing protein 1-like isoform X2 n=1 Tax=Aethina tumida TaxID=116153 RepID=UPI0021491E35|nr:endonuclease/exonuclease/phosphatase family domain-containing protein 1-like isoform X2 [Aethina tumida]